LRTTVSCILMRLEHFLTKYSNLVDNQINLGVL